MRLATLIISLCLMVILGLQSCTVAVGGSLAADLSSAAEDQQEAEDLAGGGGVGIIAALLWLIAAAFVMGKPRVSVWLFGIAAVLLLIGGSTGFTDLYIWAVVSVVFSIMSWFGNREKTNKEAEERARYEADVEAAAERRTRRPSEPADARQEYAGGSDHGTSPEGSPPLDWG